MRQFGLDTVYAGLTIEQEAEGSTFDYSPVSVDLSSVSIFDLATQGYGHDKALSAYVSLAFDDMLENITERGSIDIETDDATLFCCACAACAGEQEAGPVMIDGFVTLASLLQSDMGDETADTYLGNVLEDAYGIDQADASQYLFNPVTGEFVLVEGFDGHLTKGATLDLQDDGTAIVNGGASSATATAAASGDQRIDGVINGDYWSNSSISYAFSLSAAPYNYAGTGNEALPENFNQAISAMQEDSAHFALSATDGIAAAAGFSVEGFTNLDVNFLGNVDSTTAEIRFAETNDPGTGTARVADFPGGQVTSSPNDDGDVWFGVANNFRIAEAGNYQWMTMIHEIGHALGLKHGHLTYNFGALPTDVDSTEYSIMTYRSYIGQNPNGGATNEQWGFPQTFMMFDIAALQYFHGADFTANSGDTIYSWDPTSGDTVIDGNIAIAPGGNRIYATIWDGDGVDTYDLSAYATGVSIDLSPGGFSVFSAAQQASIGGGNFARGNIFNALQYQGDARSLIENAIGGSGDDTFTGNTADNSFTGGAGVDTADYSAITDDLTVSLGAAPGASSVEAGTDVFDSIENFISGSGSDVVDGSAVANIIKGGDGDDTIDGMDGDDVLWGEIGDDTIIGGAGDDVLRGGNDFGLVGPGFGDGQIARAAGAGNDSIANALSIDDEYSLAADADIIDAETSPHVSVSATGDETVHFYSFTVYGNDSTVTLDIDYGETGGAGSFDSFLEVFDANGASLGSNDFFPFVTGAGGSTSSNDAYIQLSIATPGTYFVAVSASGGGGVPVNATYELQVSVENNVLSDPDTGSDTLNGGMGNDMLFGGAGTDYASFSGIQANYTVTDNMDGTYLVIDNVGTDGTDTLDNIEFLIFSDVTVDIVTAASGMSGGGDIDGTPGNDNLVGTSADDVINGLGGNDILDGLAGDDVLNGGDGADRFIGGEGADEMNGDAGFDSVDYRGAASRVAFNVDTGGTVGDAAGDTYSGIERYYLSDFNDTITGSSANEFFYGEDGKDTINAGGGIDRLYGGDGDDIQRGQDGNDQLYGSAGNDQLNGGTGFDVANYSLAAASVTVNMLSGGTSGDADGDTYFGIEAVYGTDFDDSLTGNNSANELRGGDGDDMLFGLGGNDRFFGGEGADSFDGGAGIDIVNYTLATSFVWVNLTTSGSFGEAQGDSYTSVEWVFGSGFDDRITGDAGNNRLEGRDGDDELDGGAGNDRLLGGEGNDRIFGGDGVDIIFGGNGDDQLEGDAGNDFFFGGAGADSHFGGTGLDTVSYLTSSTGLTVNLGGLNSTGDAAGDDFFSIERVFGSGFDDILIGGADAVTLIGNGGNDYLEGGDENDSLIGGAGMDSYGFDENGISSDIIIGFTTNEVIYLLGNSTDFDTWAEVQAVGKDVGANVIFDFGFGTTLTIVGQSIANLDASNFDFSGMPPTASAPVAGPDADADAFAADMVDVFDMDALI